MATDEPPARNLVSTVKLTERVIKFIDAYAGPAQGDGKKAAILAGYSPKCAAVLACRYLKDGDVQAALVNRQREIANQTLIEERTSEIQRQIVAVGKIADAAERRAVLSQMLLDKDFNPAARVKAADILNKMDGVYVKRLDVRDVRSLEDLVASEARP